MAKKQETKNGERDETPSAPSEMGLATVSEVLSFGKSSRTKMIMIAGVFCALIAGAVGPVMIWYFAESYQELVADPTTDQFMDEVRRLAYTFLVLGYVVKHQEMSLRTWSDSSILCTAESLHSPLYRHTALFYRQLQVL